MSATLSDLESFYTGPIPQHERDAANARWLADHRRFEALTEGQQLLKLIDKQRETVAKNRAWFADAATVYLLTRDLAKQGRADRQEVRHARDLANLHRRHWVSSRQLLRKFERDLAALADIAQAAE